MLAPVLLSDYKMKKKELLAKRESEAPVTLGFMREFRAEIASRFFEVEARFEQADARIDETNSRFDGVNARIDGTNARIDRLEAKIDQAVAEMKTMNHQMKLLIEEQNLRNKQAYDGYTLTYGAIQDLKNRIKPECLED
ncbi:MAG: hypothetical protein AABZ31_03000 [Bdellovibrionota bacterium]